MGLPGPICRHHVEVDVADVTIRLEDDLVTQRRDAGNFERCLRGGAGRDRDGAGVVPLYGAVRRYGPELHLMVSGLDIREGRGGVDTPWTPGRCPYLRRRYPSTL